MMAPQIHKFPRLWKPVIVNVGKGITWFEWLINPNGGNVSENDLITLSEQEEHEIKSTLAALYRKFTDQLMKSIESLGAP